MSFGDVVCMFVGAVCGLLVLLAFCLASQGCYLQTGPGDYKFDWYGDEDVHFIIFYKTKTVIVD